MTTPATRLLRAITALSATAALCLGSAHAQSTYDWSGTTDGNMFGTPANWGGVEPTATDTARWNSATYTTAPSANGNMTIGQLLFGAGNTGNVTFGAGNSTLTLNGISGTGIQINSGSGAVNTGSAKFALGASQNWTNNAANTLTINGTVNLGANTFTLNGTGNTTFAGVISGAGSNLAVSGGGTTTLRNPASTFGGVGSTITVSGGSTLATSSTTSSNPNVFGNSANSIVVNGGTLRFAQISDPNVSLANAIEFQTGGANVLSNAGSATNRGIAFSGVLTGSGGFTATNSATLSIMALLNISGNSTLSGTVTAAGGTLSIASNSSRDALAGASLNLNGGRVVFTGSAANAGAIADFSRAINVESASSLGAGAGFTFTQTGTLTGTSTLSINTATNGMFQTTSIQNQILVPGTTSVVVLNGNATGFFGGLTVDQGTLRIGSAATLPGQLGLLTMSNTAGANADLNGRSITVRGLATGGAVGGNIQGNSTGSANTLTVNTTGTDRSYAGIISNGGSVALNLTKIGTNVQTLTGANTYNGTNTINGGTLTTTTGTNTTARIQGGGGLALGGGILSVTGSTTAATNVTQSFGGTTLNPGNSGVTNASGVGTSVSTVALGAITRNTGSQVNFTLTGNSTITTTTANTAGILGGYASVGLNDWATSAGDGTNAGAITAFSGYQGLTNSALLGTSGFETNVNYTAAATGTVAANSTVNSIRVAAASTITLAGNLTVTSGGILIPSTGGSTLITGGTLRGTAATGLNLFNRIAASDLRIASVIADNGGATALTINSASFVVLTGTTVNTYSGETYISGTGTRLRLGGAGVTGSNANLGNQTVGAALNINGGALYYDGNFALDNAGANKRNVVIGSAGATFRPIPTATTDALTISGVISGSDFGVVTFGGATDLTNGGGNLILTGNNTYNGGTVISGTNFTGTVTNAAPTLILGHNNALGTGALTFAGVGTTSNVLGLRSVDATALTLANRIGDLSGSGVTLKFGSSTTGNLTFTDTTSASLGAGANRSFQVDNAQTSFANGFSNTSAVIKTGTGTLVFSGVNTYTGATTISAGFLQLGNGGTTGSLSTSSAITNNANLIINRSNAVAQGTDFSGAAITGNGSFTQAGGGTTTLNAANTYSGGTTVTLGTLKAGSSTAFGTGGVTINGGKLDVGSFTLNNAITLTAGTVTGTGTLNADLALNSLSDVLSPGNSPGILSLGVAQTWSSFTYDWEVNDFDGTVAGTSFDQIAITGGLTLSGSSNSIQLNVIGLDALNATGLVPDFAEINRSWTIVSSDTAISGFDAAHWDINTTSFGSPFTGTWTVELNDNDIDLVYTTAAVPEPSSYAALAGVGVIGFALYRRRRSAK